MRRRKLLSLWLGLAMMASSARAGRVVEATPHRDGDWLVVDVRAVDLLDARTRSTVESGLPGSCRLEILLQDERGKVAATRVIERSLEFDLWEGIVRLQEGTLETIYDSIAAADSAWSQFARIRLARFDQLVATTAYRLRIHVQVDPLGAEEHERVSRWVSESQRGDRRELAFDIGGLVRRFIGKPSTETDVVSYRGATFHLGDVRVREAEEPGY